MKQRLAIIGASDFQNPLIEKAKVMGLETHVFAWEDGSIGERTADVFHPVSITEIDEIERVCRELDVAGICSIGTDLGNITVSEVAGRLGLCANTSDCVRRSTNKHVMRETFAAHGDPSPWSYEVRSVDDLATLPLSYPLIVKPVDRSGSRCITRLASPNGLHGAVQAAIDVSFDGAAVVEEFVTGVEYSVEFISWQGEHTFLALTKKFTTGAPHFIETGHLEPAPVSNELKARIAAVVSHALDSLGVTFGASHAEVLVTPAGDIKIVEIGSRMGGDCIGSDLVELSTGVDFVRAVIDIALGKKPDLRSVHAPQSAMIRFVFGAEDAAAFKRVQADDPELLQRWSIEDSFDHEIVDSASRYGFFIMAAADAAQLAPYLPQMGA